MLDATDRRRVRGGAAAPGGRGLRSRPRTRTAVPRREAAGRRPRDAGPDRRRDRAARADRGGRLPVARRRLHAGGPATVRRTSAQARSRAVDGRYAAARLVAPRRRGWRSVRSRRRTSTTSRGCSSGRGTSSRPASRSTTDRCTRTRTWRTWERHSSSSMAGPSARSPTRACSRRHSSSWSSCRKACARRSGSAARGRSSPGPSASNRRPGRGIRRDPQSVGDAGRGVPRRGPNGRSVARPVVLRGRLRDGPPDTRRRRRPLADWLRAGLQG